jgi:hypothetical protein
VNFEIIGKEALLGVLHGNLPEMAGAIGAYMTFRDKPYAFAIAMDQVKQQALYNSLTGAGVALLAELGGATKHGRQPRKRRNRRRKGSK